METEVKLGHYPFTGEEEPSRIHSELRFAFNTLLEKPLFGDIDKKHLERSVAHLYIRAERMFAQEEQARQNGEDGANLYYHNVNHAVRQATWDGAITLNAILAPDNENGTKLTKEAVLGGLTGLTYHDTGLVFGTKPGENYAARGPIHVQESVKAMSEALTCVDLPQRLDKEKIRIFATLAIEATEFPYTAEQEQAAEAKISELSQADQEAAQIVRHVARLADLGGQTARNDYRAVHLANLRREMNCAQEGLGDRLIGQDHEIDEKCKEFMENVVDRTVGRYARALLGPKSTIYISAWEKQS